MSSGPSSAGFAAHHGRLTAHLARALGLGHLALAEDAVQTAMLRATGLWPQTGLPDNPLGWLYRVAWRFAVDRLRKEGRFDELPEDDAPGALPQPAAAARERFAGELDDDELALLFAACHPALPLPSQVALALKAITGLPLKAIADGLLSSEAAIAQRLARARERLRGESLGVPPPEALPARREAVLATLLLMFNAGYRCDDTVTPDARRTLCWEAVRLARAVAAHPSSADADADALAALLLLHGARLTGRVDADGDIVPLPGQPRDRWDAGMIALGLRHLQRARHPTRAPSRYHLLAGIAAEHAIAPSYAETHWQRITAYYALLLEQDGSSAPRLGHAIALTETGDSARAEAALRALLPEVAPGLKAHALAALAHALQARGDLAGARVALAEAAGHAPSTADRRSLEQRLQRLADAGGGP